LDFVFKKGPDFKSRLVGFLNVLGPNIRQKTNIVDGRRVLEDDLTDLCYPIRRALFIRAQFKLKDGVRLQIDAGVLRAMLEIKNYKAGARSLEFLCTHLRAQAGDSTPRRSHVPGKQLLDMHVDAKAFWDICEKDTHFSSYAQKLASVLHENYRLRIAGKAEKAKLDVDFNKLDIDHQEANIAQALRIPDNLRLVGLCLVPGEIIKLADLSISKSINEGQIRDFLLERVNLDVLAEAEHNGWMAERMLNKWRYGKKLDEEKRLHPMLIPYSQLSEDDKDYDRETIGGKAAPPNKPDHERFGYVDIVKTIGFRVARYPATAAQPA
jgi:hypothetical protein